MIPVILGVAIIIFTIMNFIPGDPALVALGGNASAADVAAKREQLGLNEPFIMRLGNYLQQIFFHFDFGNSLLDGSSITEQLMQRFPRTVILALSAMLLSIVVGMPLGIVAAVHPNKWQDTVAMFIALVGCSVPVFWLGLMLVLFFAVKLQWFPASGIGGLKYYILPCIANSFMGIAIQARQTRTALLEVMQEEYLTTAQAKGVKERRILFGHALPNAMIPIVTALGLGFGSQIAGSLIIEDVFAIPGIGQYVIQAVNMRDYNIVQSGVVFIAIVFSIVMLATDIVYAFVDPRIKAQMSSGKGKKVKA